MEESTMCCSIHTGEQLFNSKAALRETRESYGGRPESTALQMGADSTPGVPLQHCTLANLVRSTAVPPAQLPCPNLLMSKSCSFHLISLSTLLHLLIANWSRLPLSLVIASLQVSGSQAGPIPVSSPHPHHITLLLKTQ